MSKVLGIMTARGGSKGIPGKNIKLLKDKPLIAYTIEAARKSAVLDRIILSTDDVEIARVASGYGCEVPFMRPANLADDKTAHLPVIQHALNWLRDNEEYHPDYVMVLQPTAPLRQAFHIKEAVDTIIATGADSVLAVTDIPETFSPHKSMVLDSSGGLILHNGLPVRKRVARRQDLLPAYRSIGSIYLFKTELLFDPKEPNFYGDRVLPYIVDKKYAIDIDVPEDWEEAEKALGKLLLQ